MIATPIGPRKKPRSLPAKRRPFVFADYVPHPDAGEADKEKEDFHKRDVSNQADAG